MFHLPYTSHFAHRKSVLSLFIQPLNVFGVSLFLYHFQSVCKCISLCVCMCMHARQNMQKFRWKNEHVFYIIPELWNALQQVDLLNPLWGNFILAVIFYIFYIEIPIFQLHMYDVHLGNTHYFFSLLNETIKSEAFLGNQHALRTACNNCNIINLCMHIAHFNLKFKWNERHRDTERPKAIRKRIVEWF